jgi:hypothetical protein
MSERSARLLDLQVVEKAEELRKTGKVVEAAEMAATALGFPDGPLGRDEIKRISEDSEQRAVLACLARIHVDTLKTMANQTPQLGLTLRTLPKDVKAVVTAPNQILGHLSSASRTIQQIYKHEDLVESLHGVEKDHRGTDHRFLEEMSRDKAKVAFAAAPLFEPDANEALVLLGEKILEETYQTLPFTNSTKYLIGIELLLSRANRDAFWDKEVLLRSFDVLAQMERYNNPERVVTAASWLVVLGEKISDAEILGSGLQEYEDIIEKQPEYGFMVPKERQKQRNWQRRQVVLRAVTPITTKKKDRDTLLIGLHNH